MPTLRKVFHLTCWGAKMSSLAGASFIHLCRFEQLEGVRRRHFGGGRVRVWELDEAMLDPTKLVDEDSYGHGSFPHYYDELPAAAVIRWVDVESSMDLMSAETSDE
ncbi:MAG: DUF952 domain-containing protein [Deltaproteobacteria bacterium]|nr:DUF952 domain-containing protein [Deltaproteobacteria bacterium]